jgi:hypothetical protein
MKGGLFTDAVGAVGSDESVEASRPRKLLRRGWVRVFPLLVLAGLVLGFAGLESLRFLAWRGGVESVALPPGSEIERLSSSADYVDAYRAPVAGPIPLEVIERLAFQRGTEVAASPNEVVFESTAPGLRFLVSYYLTDPDQSQTVTVGTAVFYESFLGWLYFTPVKQVHKRGVPFAVSRMLRGVRSQGG